MKYLKERKEPTRYLRQPWFLNIGSERVTFMPHYDSAERKLVVHTSDLATIEAPVEATRSDVEALYRERFQR